MDVQEAGAMLPRLLAQVYPGMSEELVPGQLWKLRRDTSLAVVAAMDAPLRQLRITVGVVTDVPLNAELAFALNDANRDLWYGRTYMDGDWEIRKGSVLMQEIIPTALLSLQYRPSLQFVSTVIGSLTDTANDLCPTFVERFGARPLFDEEVRYLVV